MRGMKGFTLLELLVVIAIIAIVSGVGLASYNAYVSYAQKKVVAHETSLMKSATEMAKAIPCDSDCIIIRP